MAERKHRGTNKRPEFASKEERAFFEKTPKHVLFGMLRQACIMHVSLYPEHDGYLDTWMWHDNPNVWMEEAKRFAERESA